MKSLALRHLSPKQGDSDVPPSQCRAQSKGCRLSDPRDPYPSSTELRYTHCLSLPFIKSREKKRLVSV